MPSRKELAAMRVRLAAVEFADQLESVPNVAGLPVLTAILPATDADTLRQMADRFRQRYPEGIAILASSSEGRPIVVASVSDDLVKRGFHAGDLVKRVAAQIGGGGGGKPTLAQAGGKDAARLEEALTGVADWIKDRLK